MEYDLEARRRLGRAVRAARTSAGFTNRAEFADKLKRSARQVQALENGESGVGPDTWAAAAEVLGWQVDDVYALLENRQPVTSAPTPLTAVSDEELAAEVLRRMRERGDRGGDTAATMTPAREPAHESGGLRAVASEGDRDDAAEVERIAADERRRQGKPKS